jgi:hypothetical protein
VNAAKKWALRLGLLCVGPLLVLLLIELVWHLVGDPRITANEAWLETRPAHFKLGSLGMLRTDPDPAVLFTLQPGFATTIDGDVYRINEHGMRGGPVTIDKPAGTRRIIVLGDSYAFGFGVDEAETISAQLEAALRDRHAELQVLNMGVPGYQTGQEERVLRRDGMRFCPDLVVLVYYANDNVRAAFHHDPRLRLTYVDELPLPLGAKRFLARSILYSKIAKGYTAAIADRLESTGASALQHNWPTTIARLERIQQLCAKHGATLVLVAIPALSTSKEFIDASGEFNVDHDQILAQVRGMGIGVVDFRATLLRWSLGGNGAGGTGGTGGKIPATALTSTAALRRWIGGELGQPPASLGPDDLMRGLVALGIGPKPIEHTFVGPTYPKKDSHLTGEGYGLLVRDLVRLITDRGLLR